MDFRVWLRPSAHALNLFLSLDDFSVHGRTLDEY